MGLETFCYGLMVLAPVSLALTLVANFTAFLVLAPERKRRRRNAPTRLGRCLPPPITILKPVKGDEDGLYENAERGLLERAQPIRWLAEGRDASATLDSANNGFGKNDGDNEVTGPHVSDGDPSVEGILGSKDPSFGKDGWRWFWTQQHGDNLTFEVLPAR